MDAAHRSHPALHTHGSRFQFRASQIFRRITQFGGRTGVNGVGRTNDATRRPMNFNGQPKASMSQPTLALHLRTTTEDTEDGSSISPSGLTHESSQRISESDYGHPTPTAPPLEATTTIPAQGEVNSSTQSTLGPSTNGQLPMPHDLSEIASSEPTSSQENSVSLSKPSTTSGRLSRDGPSIIPSSTSSPLPDSNPSHRRPRSPPPHLSSLPPRSRSLFNAEAVGGRLSPSIVFRQPPMPLNLPPLPTPTPTPTSPDAPSRQRLRTMPELLMQGSGTDDGGHEPDLDIEGDEDEEDDPDEESRATSGAPSPRSDNGAGDAESEDEEGESFDTAPSSLPSSNTLGSRKSGMRPIGLTPVVVLVPASGDPPAEPSISQEASTKKTPGESLSRDYFTPWPEDSSHTSTPRPADTKFRHSVALGAQGLPIPLASGSGTPRIRLYRQTSKSMVNVGLTTPKQVVPPTPAIGKAKGKAPEAPLTAVADLHTHHESPASIPDGQIGPSLQRRRSMPTFVPAHAPPSYPSFARHPQSQVPFVIQPRDEEGKEHLPCYSNDIYLAAIMPRKMEFTQPGVQAKDRKWRRALCVLEGTMFKVYNVPPVTSGVGVIGEWWEKTVGVGDVRGVWVSEGGIKKDAVPATPKTGLESEPAEQGRATVELRVPERNPQPSSAASGSSSTLLARPSTSSSSRASSSSRPPTPSSCKSRRKFGVSSFLRPSSSSGSRAHSRSLSESPGDLLGRRVQQHRHTESNPLPSSSTVTRENSTAEPSECSSAASSCLASSRPGQESAELIRSYTLQHAESGLGTDYEKRKNVIRVRMEGEQFLLQAKDVAAVVEWIEGIQAATNIALDLDERVMPKGPMFPRRRRRANGRPDTASTRQARSRPTTAQRPP